MPYIGRELDRGNYLKLDDISSSFNGSLTTFNLTNGGKAFYPGSAFSILVVLAGVVQEPEAAYQINQAQITFASAPVAGDQFFCIALGVALGVNVPANGSVNGTQLAKPFNYDGYFYLDDVNNRVGIATATPQKPLHVVGEGQFDSVRVLGDLTVDGTTTTLDTVVTEVDKLEVLANNSTVAVAVTQSGSGDAATFEGGNVGIGTNNAGQKLHVSGGTGTNIQVQQSNGNLYLGSSGSTRFGLASGANIIQSAATDFGIGSQSGHNLIFGTNNTKRLQITDQGDFHIQWNNNNFLGSYYDADYYMGLSFGANRRELYIDNRSNDTRADIVFRTIQGQSDPTEKLRITSGGNIGIGNTDTPQSLLEVYGTSPIVRSKHSTSQKYTQINHDGTSGYLDWSSGDLILRGPSDTERLRIKNNGRVAIGSQGIASYLIDARTDENPSSGVIALLRNNQGNGTGAFLAVGSNLKGNYSIGMPDNTDAFTIVDELGNNGTERLRISSAGNIGIGTVNVVAKVDIISGTGDGTQNEANCLRLRNRANNGNAMTLQVGVNTAAAGGFNQGYAYLQGQFWGGGANPIFLNPKGGNIGIGRTGAYVPLDVNGDTILRAAGNTTQGDITRRCGFTGPSNTSNPTSYIAGVADKTNWYQGLGLVFATVSGNDIGNTLGVERMRISSDGNVGIGEDNPSAKLEVRSAGATAVFNSGAANDGRLEFEYDSSRVGLLAYHSDRLEIQTDSSKDFTIRTNGANERLRITSGGNVGVNTNNPGLQAWRSGKILDIHGGAGNVTGELHIGANRGDGAQSVGSINFYDNSQDSSHRHVAIIESDKGGTTSNKRGGQLVFYTKPDNVAAPVERMRIQTDGTVDFKYGAINLGTADSSSGHINAYELMTFNIDSDNDDTNRHFAWFKDGASGGGTELARLTETGNLGIGEDTPIGMLHLNRDTQTTNSYGSASLLRVDGSRGADELVGIGFNYYAAAGNIPQAFIGMKTKDWVSYTNAHLVFATREVTTNSEPTERLRINHDGIINASMNTTAVALPTGTTAQRPTGTDAYIRKNTTNNALEYYDGTSWVEIITDYFPTGSTILG